MTGMGLTARERELLAYLGERDLCPNRREIRRALRISNNILQAMIVNLGERGFLRMLPKRANAIEINRLKVIMTTADCERLFESNRLQEAA